MDMSQAVTGQQITQFVDKWSTTVAHELLPRLRKQYELGANKLDVEVKFPNIIAEILELTNGGPTEPQSMLDILQAEIKMKACKEFNQSHCFVYLDPHTPFRDSDQLPVHVVININ